MEKKYCYNCGEQIDASTKFCPNCGANQMEGTQSVDANDAQSEPQSYSNASQGVSMGKAFKLFWKNYFNFGGKSTRSEFWFWYLWQLIIVGGITLLTVLLMSIAFISSFNVGAGIGGIMIIIGGVWGIATFFPNLTLTIRRMRDAGHHNAIIVFILLPFYVFGIFSEMATPFLVLAMIFALMVLVSVCSPSADE